MKIRFFGHRNIMGGGVHFSNFTDAFKRLVTFDSVIEEADPVNADQFRDVCLASQPDDINIHFMPYPLEHPLQGINVLWGIFEYTEAPQVFLDFYRDMNCRLFWTPSTWGKQVLCNAGIRADEIDIVPEGVDPNVYHPYHRATIPRHPRYTFLTIGKMEGRKSYPELLLAFKAAFNNDPGVWLYCKADFFNPSMETYTAKQVELQSLINKLGLTNVECLWGTADLKSMLAIYTACDAFVFPSKGEGWGLPLIDAIASGLPVITTFHSGHTEYIQHLSTSLIKVDFQLIPVGGNELGLWANPKIDSLARGMRYCVDNRQRLAQEAIRASSVIRSQFSWEQAAIKAMDSLIARGLFKIQ